MPPPSPSRRPTSCCRWSPIVEEYGAKFGVSPVRLGRGEVAKQIFLGFRETDADIDYLRTFVDLVRAYRDTEEQARS